MPARYVSPSGSSLLTGSAVITPATAATANTSSARFTSTATRVAVTDASGASSARFTSTASGVPLVSGAEGASSARFTSAATYAVTVDVTGASSALFQGWGTYEGETRDAWVTNIDTKAIGRYTAFDFNSFANVGNRTFGFSDDGVYEIVGTTDAGQPIPFFLMSESYSRIGGDAGLGMLHPHTAYIVGDLPESPSVVNLFVATDNDDVYSYPVGETDTRMSTARVLVGKGLRTRYLRYGLVGTAVDTVELASVSFKAKSSSRNV